MKNILRRDFLIYIFIFIVVLLSKWDFLNLPFYYEERPFTVLSIDKFSLIDLIFGNFDSRYFAGHPILMPLMTNFFVKVYSFIDSPSTLQFKVHLFFTFVASGTLMFMYKTMNKVLNVNSLGSVCCIILLFSYPDFFVHSTNLRIDIFAGLFAIALIYFRLNKNFKLFLVTGILMSQTRETILAFFVSNLILDSYVYYKSKVNLKYIAASITHILFYSTFFIKSYLNQNTLSSSPALSEITRTIKKYFEILWFDVKWLFIQDYRFILVSISFFCIFLFWKKKGFINYKFFYLLLPIIFYILGMSFHIFEATYYFFPVLPILYILITLPMLKVISQKYMIFLIFTFLQFHLFLNNEKSKESMSENGTGFVDILENFKNTHAYLEEHRDTKINAEWPLDGYLSSSVYGYGKGYRSVSPSFNNVWATELGHRASKKVNCTDYNYDIIVVTEQSPTLKVKSQMNLIQKCEYVLIKNIIVKGRVTKIYGRSRAIKKI